MHGDVSLWPNFQSAAISATWGPKRGKVSQFLWLQYSLQRENKGRASLFLNLFSKTPI